MPLLLGLYVLVRQSRILSTIVLIVGSAIFYAWKTIWWLVPLVIVATVDYFVGMKMANLTDDRIRKRWLILSLVINLAMLSAFKYLGWFTGTLNDLLAVFGIAATVPVITTTLPPGISFYTFETMSYTIDVYRRHFRAEPSYLIYLNFVLFFPHLVAGPILRPGDLIGQLKVVRPLPTPDELRLALSQIFWGLFKKIVFADNLGDVVSYAVRATTTPPYESGGVGLLYAVGFTLQIYCDFSAYSDIARGSALLFGIKLPRNFLTPIFSRSPQEFWRRWHITLSTWIRDYVYIPLGGRAGSYLRQSVTILLTMGLAGLWHGAGFMFICWGFFHGVLILIYRLKTVHLLIERSGAGLPALASWGVFFVINTFGWLMFRAGSGHEHEFRTMVDSFGAFPGALLSHTFLEGLRQLGLLGIPMLLADWTAYRRDTEVPEVLASLSTVRLSTALVSMWFAGMIFAKRSGYDFIYFAF
ncbi:MBOAT family O-acyltransferase [Enhydrobacter aerosaccus]|uniref:MBOAT family O-acyltransferase n=1 Tax=Enhydrobacter aerosaccus TaxID=225324 RepID=UPI001483C9FE|nr:MBOAT family protein [Enhydrobacter aerosaccus]